MGRNFEETAIGNLQINKRRAFVFFAAYARYEYAAKALGWVQDKSDEARLKICLKTIAAEISGNFEKLVATDGSLATAVAYYTTQPPKKQVWKDGRPIWKEVTHTEPPTHRLLLQLAQARNNLFHGGKGWKPEGQADRDNKIVEHGAVILEAVVKSSEALTQEFSSYG